MSGVLLSEALHAQRFHPGQTRRVGAQVAAALAALHALGQAHGDVRTGTIVLGADGRARLTVPEAPEEADPAEDVHDLGRALLACLTHPACDEVDGGLTEPWPGLLITMLADEPRDRPTAGQVAATLAPGPSVSP